MKTKLTLSIDITVADAARKIYRSKKRSISSLVEEYFMTMSEKRNSSKKKKGLSFTEKFRQKFPPPAKKYTDKGLEKSREEYLMKKYGR